MWFYAKDMIFDFKVLSVKFQHLCNSLETTLSKFSALTLLYLTFLMFL